MTLIEILVAVSITGILATSGYGIYAAATGAWTQSRRRIDMIQRGRVALDLIDRCVRAAQSGKGQGETVFDALDEYMDSPGGETEGRNADRLRLRTNAPLYLFGGKEIADQAEVEFSLDVREDGETGRRTSNLCMRVDDTYDTDATDGGWIIEVAESILQVDILCFDGTDWQTEWDSSQGLPKAVAVSLVVGDNDGKEAPMTFSRTVEIKAPGKPAATGGSGGETAAAGGTAGSSEGGGAGSAEGGAQNSGSGTNNTGGAGGGRGGR